MFIPPRCPYLACSQHLRPEPGFFRRRGRYRPLCRPEGVPRFRCTTYRNYVRRRFNRDKEANTPAKILGLLPRNLLRHEVLAWRQDWGDLSIHPMSHRGSYSVRQAVPA